MILTIVSYRFPDLPGAIHMALRAFLWGIALLVMLALAVAVLVAVTPYLPQMAAGAFIVGAFALITYPRPKVK